MTPPPLSAPPPKAAYLPTSGRQADTVYAQRPLERGGGVNRVAALVLLLLVTGCDRFTAKAPTWEQLVLRTEKFYRQEKYAQAMEVAQQALALAEQLYGPRHPAVAQSLHNIAGLHMNAGRYAEAEPLYRRSLAIREAVLGPNHPVVAESLDLLASLCDIEGRAQEAEALYARAIAIRKHAPEPDHPDTATDARVQSILLRKVGQVKEAEAVEARAHITHADDTATAAQTGTATAQ